MAKGQRNLVLERQWRERVSAWTKSGLTVRDYCLRHGLRETSFHHWRRELRQRDTATSSRPVSDQPTFVPVTVLPAATMSVEVRCPSGHVVILPSCDVSSFSNLFAALASPAPEERPC
jgi:transposase-like protein